MCSRSMANNQRLNEVSFASWFFFQLEFVTRVVYRLTRVCQVHVANRIEDGGGGAGIERSQ